jgi:chorismate dehydratase
LQDSSAVDLAEVFRQSRDHGLAAENLGQIAREWSAKLALSEAAIRTYLTENIHYELDVECVEGLQLFYRYAAEIGALPAAPELNFLEPAHEIVAPAPVL